MLSAIAANVELDLATSPTQTEGSISSSGRKNGALNSFVTVIDWANMQDDSPKRSMVNGLRRVGCLIILLLIFVPGVPRSCIEVSFLLISAISYTNFYEQTSISLSMLYPLMTGTPLWFLTTREESFVNIVC